jgi:SAM-dependent MidA family methyltransferase
LTLESVIQAEIEGRGPMTFARFMELALYHPDSGYYGTGEDRTGPAGHFVTSAELDPLYGELWSKGFEQVWIACGRPPAFEAVEIGPGEGGFARAVLDSVSSDFRQALRYHLVEPSPAAAARQRRRLADFANVRWCGSVTAVPPGGAGCWVANEVVDNLPVHLVECRRGAIREVFVTATNGSLEFVSAPVSSDAVARFFAGMGYAVPEGHRAEVPLVADDLVRAAARRLGRGAVVLVDYGDGASGLLRRPAGSVLCYSGSGVDDRPLEGPGTKDITVHANWTALRDAMRSEGLEVVGPTPQASVLRRLGAREAGAGLREQSHAESARTALRAISRRGALAVLTDPGGLGGFGVLVGVKNCAVPAFAVSSRG